jgi:hypothetical protein
VLAFSNVLSFQMSNQQLPQVLQSNLQPMLSQILREIELVEEEEEKERNREDSDSEANSNESSGDDDDGIDEDEDFNDVPRKGKKGKKGECFITILLNYFQ